MGSFPLDKLQLGTGKHGFFEYIRTFIHVLTPYSSLVGVGVKMSG